MREDRYRVERSPEGSDVHLYNGTFSPTALLLIGMRVPRSEFPGIAAFFAIAHPNGRLEKRSVYFVEDDAMIVRQVRGDPVSPMARLLVTREEACAAGAVIVDVSEPVEPSG